MAVERPKVVVPSGLGIIIAILVIVAALVLFLTHQLDGTQAAMFAATALAVILR